MNKENPISVYNLKLCDISKSKRNEIGKDFEKLRFNNCHDFIIDENFVGIVAEIDFYNELNQTTSPRGVRRKVSATIVDMTSRYEVATRQIKVRIAKERILHTTYLEFTTDETEFLGGHTYKIIITDETSSSRIHETVFHLFDRTELGDPYNWYTVDNGGLRSPYKKGIYKSLNLRENELFYIRFNLQQHFGDNIPKILPELELRLYFPDEQIIYVHFYEPECFDYDSNTYFIEMPFVGEKFEDAYYVEMLCMDYPIAGFVFNTNREDISGSWEGEDLTPIDEYTPEATQSRFNRLLPSPIAPDSNDLEFEEALNAFITKEMDKEEKCEEVEGAEETEEKISEDTPFDEMEDQEKHNTLLSTLNNLTGLDSVKQKLAVYERIVRFNKMRTDNNLPVFSCPLHAMFLGSPGTGKTTVAKIMGIMLRRAGVLSRGQVVVRERATLLGQFYNSESEKTLAAIEEAQGGILFIDEAHQLFQPSDPRDPGRFVIETLLTTLADESKRDWMLVLAGYPDEMKKMFDMNPGFKSRIPDSNIYTFEDFTEQELMEIAEKYLSRLQYTLTPEAHKALERRLSYDYSVKDKKFGNARHVLNLIQTEILPAMAIRVTSDDSHDATYLMDIREEDVPIIFRNTFTESRRIGFAG